MSPRRASDDRYARKLELLQESGAVRMPTVPFSREALLTLSAISGYSYDELLAMDDIDLGRVAWVELVREERGDAFLPEISEPRRKSV